LARRLNPYVVPVLLSVTLAGPVASAPPGVDGSADPNDPRSSIAPTATVRPSPIARTCRRGNRDMDTLPLSPDFGAG